MSTQQNTHHVGGQHPESGNHREDTVPGGCGSKQPSSRR